MSATAERLFDDYWFVLARTGRARGPGGADQERLAPPAMRQSILSAVRRKPQVMVKITSFARSKEGLAAHLDYISRNGQNEVFDPAGEGFSAIGDQMGLTARDALQHYGRELATGPISRDVPTNRNKKGRPRSRVSMNLMLSMPAGTDTGAFELAVREFLAEQFQAHDRVFTFHDDRDHYHAHVVIGLQGQDGRWLNPRKKDLLAWREAFAASLERHGIPAEATPAYTRGQGKNGYRRDLEELRRRGARERPDPSPSFDAEIEERAIRRRAEAWTRIADHYAEAGDREAAGAIRDYVADHFDYRPETEPETDPAPGQAPRPEATPAPVRAPTLPKRPRDRGRER
ncbi:MAG: relaxase/mobilization nuclease domain-containing protein [Bdellovibrio bacteriovorus]